MMTSKRWYETGRDALWRKLLAENPIMVEAFEVVLRTTMELRDSSGEVVIQALQNAKRDGIFGTLKLLEVGLANPLREKNEDPNPLAPIKAWTKPRKKKVDNESTNQTV